MNIRRTFRTLSIYLDLIGIMMGLGIAFYALADIMIRHSYEETTFILLLVSLIFLRGETDRFKLKYSRD